LKLGIKRKNITW